MPLDHKDQINLMKDILTNQQSDCCGSVSECEQLERLIKSLMISNNIHDNVKPVLEEIYSYSQNGKYSSDLDEHITAHQERLSQWVEDIGDIT
ncbi:YtzH-like family protein [Bacillus massilinigeriensis]|uniref:YtzH-like family protein n=1 Tax=Bacillus mediterraneensis TaxID=1805474 RepID=UPI0008F7F95A|nr:YtzH-like family protein [Bacillus mediterraneensis]